MVKNGQYLYVSSIIIGRLKYLNNKIGLRLDGAEFVGGATSVGAGVFFGDIADG